MREGLSFEDITIIPKRSAVESRRSINTSSEIAKGTTLKMPIISSNMDTVTEWKMAVEMARMGGVGFIHRYMSIEEEKKQVALVKRKRNIIIQKPLIVNEDNTLKEAKELMSTYHLTGALVCENNKLKGLLSRRDYNLRGDYEKVRDLMTPIKDVIWAAQSIVIEEAKKILLQNKIEKLPLLDKEGGVMGLITLKDLLSLSRESSVDEKGRFIVGAAVGVKEKDIRRAEEMADAEADMIVVDVAHGHTISSLRMVKRLRKEFSGIRIVAGNVCTKEGVEDLISAGADCVKVGIGPGSTCITRVVAGAGVPQMTAIMDCKEGGVPIISDGGIRNSGDVAKAIGAGASAVMVGTLFAGTDEAPGNMIVRNGKRVKIVRGMASTGANMGRSDTPLKKEEAEEYVPEGIENYVDAKGPIRGVVQQLTGGLRSGMSYAGAQSIKEFWEKCEFMKVTQPFKDKNKRAVQ